MRLLVVTAVTAERDACARGLPGSGQAGLPAYPDAVDCGRVTVLPGGVGPAAAGAATATALACARAAGRPYELVVSAGIGGGFPGVAPVGGLVLASEIVAADLGADSPDGFLPLDVLGFGPVRHAADPGLTGRAAAALRAAGVVAVTGPVLTVSTVTGTAAGAHALARRYPGAAAEGMEGFGVATAARAHGVPVLEVRAISNPVGPRDRATWRIREALDVLATAVPVLVKEFGT
ncbi:futalosine hydrolase [Carbonactinospora thermoautotrophica]|uniref:futalosine hydrolase n=1 Tax=Carbonactinospora thermoautotrophica TaxID=1469144 RepID=UPI00226D5454|nr:futalosine hydrolase [Carbonactinospora thermoautotrophica]MCX9192680.1 futalosine hydrolase [Carbonactinospora thermoautotrophica]